MNGNIILFDKEAQDEIAAGVDLLDRVVAKTLSPRGREVGMFAPGFNAIAIHDGVEVADKVIIDDYPKQWAIKVILQAANKQVQTVGDGTTVSIILTAEIYRKARENIIAGANPRSLVDDLIKNRDILTSELKKFTTKVETVEQAIAVATISAQDPTLGKMIGETVFKMGIDGVVTHDKSETDETYVDMQDGCQFEGGYASQYFITDYLRMEATVEKAQVLITDKAVTNLQEILPLFEKLGKSGNTNLVIIAPEIADKALEFLIVNKNNPQMPHNLLAVKAPYTGQTQKDFLDDIAILTGGVVISREQGRTLQEVKLEDLGYAKRITATAEATKLIAGIHPDPKKATFIKDAIHKRIRALKDQKARKLGKSDYENEKIRERLAKLSNGVAVIKIGAPLEIEQANYIERAKDAIRAATTALEYGYVPGGETIYLKIREKLDQSLSGRILYNALERPFHILLTNGGFKPDKFIDQVKDGMGVDVIDGQLKDMLKANIVDPTEVAVESLTNAISSAIVLFTTEVLILPKPDEKKDNK